LETNNQEQLIFKHAISTVVTPRPAHAVERPAPIEAKPAASAPQAASGVTASPSGTEG
jgi:host factor-I protein